MITFGYAKAAFELFRHFKALKVAEITMEAVTPEMLDAIAVFIQASGGISKADVYKMPLHDLVKALGAGLDKLADSGAAQYITSQVAPQLRELGAKWTSIMSMVTSTPAQDMTPENVWLDELTQTAMSKLPAAIKQTRASLGVTQTAG